MRLTLKILLVLLPTLLFIAMCTVMLLPAPAPRQPVYLPTAGELSSRQPAESVHRTSKDSQQDLSSHSSRATKNASSTHDSKGLLSLFSSVSVLDLEATDSVTSHLARLDKMPEPTQRIKVNYFGNPRGVFNDSNHVHQAAARRYGISPLSDTRSHWQNTRDIVRVTTCADFYLDTLIHSRPYLVPHAASTLHEIGRRFRDTIAARGGGDYRIKVTSLLRTPATIRRLRRSNRNAIDSSVHQLGTTFDISYASFVASSPAPARSVDDLKGLLTEVLKAMRDEGKILVKYEYRQPCFHITARLPE